MTILSGLFLLTIIPFQGDYKTVSQAKELLFLSLDRLFN
jgi:hypothetical protein